MCGDPTDLNMGYAHCHLIFKFPFIELFANSDLSNCFKFAQALGSPPGRAVAGGDWEGSRGYKLELTTRASANLLLCLPRNLYDIGNPYCPLRPSATSPRVRGKGLCKFDKQSDKLWFSSQGPMGGAHYFNSWRSHTSIIHQRSDFNIHYSFAPTER